MACMGFFSKLIGKKPNAESYREQALAAVERGEVDRALDLFARAEPLLEEAGDHSGLVEVLHNQAMILSQRDQGARALDLWRRALTIQEQNGTPAAMTRPLTRDRPAGFSARS